MPSHVLVVILLIFSSSLLFSIDAQSHECGDVGNSLLEGGRITHCKALEALGAEFGWNLLSGKQNQSGRIVDVFFRAPLHPLGRGWVAWGVNPVGAQMVGTRALISFKRSNGSLVLLPFNITGNTKRGCPLESSDTGLGFDFKIRELNHSDDGYLAMFLSLDFGSAPEYNFSKLNHVWQVGAQVENDVPFMHGTDLQNFDSRGTLNLNSGKFQNSLRRRQHLRTAHGVLNIIGWGIILPFGIIVARYFKTFPFPMEGWFRIHVPTQVLAYLTGTIGWAIGLSLGNSSKNYVFTTHRFLGIAVFAMASLQMLAIWLRPKKNDDYRKYWHIYHHFLGYALFTVIVLNIFQGIHILSAEHKWWEAYVGILSCIGFIVIVLEVITWTLFVKDRTG